MQSIMKTRQGNDMPDHKGVMSTKYDTKVSRPIRLCAILYLDEIGQ